MARSSFGGGGDYSGSFASLYAQSKALKDAQQSAADQDALDRWKNGLSSDNDWIAYIAGRVAATSSDKDPSDHQHWIQLQRQYVSSIADSTAEFSYSNGQSSIGDLIQYYQNRLSRLQAGSDEYRQLGGHLNDLVDKRDGDDLSSGAQAINSKIQAGQATYEDLLGFYKSHLANLRPGSDLFKQVSAEVSNVRDTIAQTKLNGQFERLQYLYESKQLSGASYSARLTQMAQQFKASDPQKYYQILEAANRVRTSGSGGGGGASTLGKTAKTTEDQLKSVDNYLEMFSQAYKNGARIIPDPMHPGQNIVLSPELMSQVDHQRLQNFDALATLYQGAIKDGKNFQSKYTTILEAKTKYIVDFVQPHNTVAASQQWGQLVGATMKSIAANANNADPETTLRSVVSNLNGMKAWLGSEIQRNGKIVDPALQPAGDFLENSSQFIDQTLAALTDPNMDSKSRSLALAGLAATLDTDAGAHYDKGTQAAMKSLLTQAGAVSNATFDIAMGRKVYAITPDKGLTLVDVRVQHTLTTDPATGQAVSVDAQSPDVQLTNGQRLQEIWIDKGGQPMKAFAVVDTAPSPYKVWVATKSVSIAGKTYAAGAVIPSDALGKAGFDEATQSGALAKKDAFAAAGMPLKYVQVPAYDDGGVHHGAVTYYQDPQTKLWYAGQPPIGSASIADDGTLKVAADGKLQVNWMPLANVGGVATPYAGSNKKAMQDLYNQGVVGTDPRYAEPTGYRDITGAFTTDASKSVDSTAPYFDPRDNEGSRLNGLRSLVDDQPNPQELLRQRVDAARQRQTALMSAEAKSGGQAFDPASISINAKKIADGLGIQLDSSGRSASAGLAGPDANSMLARRQKLQADLNLPTIKAAPLLPGDTRSEAHLSTGPALANLPKVGAAGFDPSKVTALPPVPETQPGATWSKPIDVNAKSTVQQATKQKSGNTAL